MDRCQKLLSTAQPDMQILEIGPSFSPVAPKKDGWNTTVVDHASRNELIAKYQSHPGVDIECIEEVDIVWAEGILSDAFPLELKGNYNLAIASHVIEHVPDLIGFIKSLEVLLKPDGIISLAIPDKRFCFDWGKSLSSTGQVLYAHAIGADRHSPSVAFDHVAYSINNDGVGAWGQRKTGELSFIHTLREAKAAFDAIISARGGPYVDYHGWHFVPSSFQLLVLELQYLGVIDSHIKMIYHTEGCEFIVILAKGRNIPESQDELESLRIPLLKDILAEVREQHEFLIGK